MLGHQHLSSLRWFYSFPLISESIEDILLCHFKNYITSVPKPTVINKKTKLVYVSMHVYIYIYISLKQEYSTAFSSDSSL